jgi:hypothetical protein
MSDLLVAIEEGQPGDRQPGGNDPADGIATAFRLSGGCCRAGTAPEAEPGKTKRQPGGWHVFELFLVK